MRVRSNPFSTRFVRPGAVEFIGADEDRWQELARQFVNQRLVGQVVGPHGSGKTTWCFSFVRRLSTVLAMRHASLLDVQWITISEKWRSNQRSVRRFRDANAGLMRSSETFGCRGDLVGSQRLLVVDGIERLRSLDRLAILAHCRKFQVGLLATTHRRLRGLSVLSSTAPSKETLMELVQTLDPDLAETDSSSRLIDNAFQRSDGNLREALMHLYDHWERRNRSLIAKRL